MTESGLKTERVQKIIHCGADIFVIKQRIENEGAIIYTETERYPSEWYAMWNV